MSATHLGLWKVENLSSALHFQRTMDVSEPRCFGFTSGSWLWEHSYAEKGLITIIAALFLVIWQNPQQFDYVIKDWVWLPSKNQSNKIMVISYYKQITFSYPSG